MFQIDGFFSQDLGGLDDLGDDLSSDATDFDDLKESE